MKWQLEDGQGKIHKLTIPNSYYIVVVLTRKLSPQQFAQQANSHKPEPNGIGCITTSSTIKLFWKQRKHSKMVTLDPKLSIVMTQTALGIKQYQEYKIEKEKKEKDINIFETHIIPEDTLDDKADDDMSFQPPDPVQPHGNGTTNKQGV